MISRDLNITIRKPYDRKKFMKQLEALSGKISHYQLLN